MFDFIFDAIFPPRGDEHVIRTLTEERVLSFLSPKLIQKTNPATVALLPFHEPEVRSLIHEAKYHGSHKAYDLLAAALHEYLHDADTLAPYTRTILPIPLGAVRRRKRGYNQIEDIARIICEKGEVPLEIDLLLRARETISQVSLPRILRGQNMLRAFTTIKAADPNLTYILLDDVVTTGATLQAAIDALKGAGARQILPVALAH